MKKSKNILIGIVIIVALIILWPIIYFYIKYIFIGGINLKINEINNSNIEQENRDENSKILLRYIEDRYGYVSTLMSIEKVDNAGINSWYVISLPFMNNFTITVDTNKKNVCRDDFYEVLANDPKFNHLYSEWVKKQIGINDPNVELIMIFNNSIDFLNIKNKDNILEELFNNIVEYKVTNAYVKNVEINNEDDLTNYANNIHDIYFTFKKYNEESSGEFNLNDSVILIKEDINFLDKNVRKLGRYLDFPWNIDEKIIEFKDGKIVKIYQH